MPDTAETTSRRVAAGRLQDLADGAIRLIEARGREIGIVRWRDQVYAVRNVCPHVAGPACGLVRPRLTAEPTQQTLTADMARPMLVCAWHKWEFDLAGGGRALFDPRLRVKTYPVDVDPGGTIWVTVLASRSRVRGGTVRAYDTVIVGAGSAGCALAARLSEDPARSVLLIEAGPDFPVAEELLPAPLAARGWDPRQHPEYGWSYAGYPTASRADTVQIFRGRTTGGSSAVNSGMFLRSIPEDFESWGSDMWSFDAVLPSFRRLEKDQDFRGDMHGTEGPIPVGRGSFRDCSPFQRAFYNAALDHRLAPKPDLNAPTGSGVGLMPRNDATGVRVSTAIAYLAPARQRPNLSILPRATVHRIGLKGRRVTHVELRADGQLQSIGAREVILCAGAIETPHILMLSGLGPAGELTRLGIDVVENLPGVGSNLADHPVAILEYEPEDRARPGGASSTGSPRCGIIHTADGSAARNDILILPVDAAHFRTPPSFAADSGHATPATAGEARVKVHCMLQLPLSRGWLRLPSPRPADSPSVHFNYFSEPADLWRLRDAVRLAVSIADRLALDGLTGPRVTPTDTELASDRALDKWLLRTFNTCYHSCGTARLGTEDDPGAVVDERACVRGVDGLRVADLSIAPQVGRGTTNPTAVMIGERVAELMATEAVRTR